MKYLLIDFGSTSIKYAVYATDTDTCSQDGMLPFPARLPNENDAVFEVDPAEIIKSLDTILHLFCDEYPDGILLSVQMHGYILNDQAGNLLTPYISWRDNRSSLPLSGSTCYDAFTRQNKHIIWSGLGTSCKPNLPLCSLYAQQYIHPTIFHSDIEFYTLGSYCSHYLTGNNISHITDCAASGFFSMNECKKATEAFPRIKLPKAVAKVQVIGDYKGIPVYAPFGDHQVTFLGCEVQDNQYLLNISTATQLSTLSNELSELYECRPYFDSRRLCTVSGLIGGRTIRELCEVGRYDENLCGLLFENYSAALHKLPQKEKILVCGGVAQHFPALINAVCERIGLPYEIKQENSAINGLKIIANEVCIHEK